MVERPDPAETRLTERLTEAAPDLLAYFQRRVGPDDAPDLLAETMVAAWRRIESLPDNAESARMWLFGAARNVLLNAERSRLRRWRLANRLRAMATVTEHPPADSGVEIRDAIARLEPELAELVRLVHWERLTVAQAAEVMLIPASTARGRYQRAKEELRRALASATSHPMA